MNSGIVEVGDGIKRVTFALPLGIDHVHCYLLPARAGGWNVVDTGLGTPDAEERWRRVLDEVGGEVERIVVTHLHPDHVGASAVVAGLTGAPVYQGRLDYEQCLRTWGPNEFVAQSHKVSSSAGRDGMAAYLLSHGMPEEELASLRAERGWLEASVRFARDPVLLDPGDSVDGWLVVHLPGHADGHIALLRDGVLVAGDALLATISPNVGLYPESRPDPLGDYFGSLSRIAELAPRVALGGHGPEIHDPAARAAELVTHHDERLAATVQSLGWTSWTAYEVSLRLFPDELPPTLRRFALAETRAHLEHLVVRGQVRRLDGDGRLTYALA